MKLTQTQFSVNKLDHNVNIDACARNHSPNEQTNGQTGRALAFYVIYRRSRNGPSGVANEHDNSLGTRMISSSKSTELFCSSEMFHRKNGSIIELWLGLSKQSSTWSSYDMNNRLELGHLRTATLQQQQRQWDLGTLYWTGRNYFNCNPKKNIIIISFKL